MNINQLVKTAYGDSCVNGWWDEREPNYAEKLALIHSEVSEALEELRNPFVSGESISDLVFDDNDKPIGFTSEMADIVIRVADLCGHLGIDLEQAISAKLEFNRERGYKHGGKQF